MLDQPKRDCKGWLETVIIRHTDQVPSIGNTFVRNGHQHEVEAIVQLMIIQTTENNESTFIITIIR